MSENSAAERVFSEWAEDDRAERMWRSHLPRAEQMWARIPASRGNYLEIGCGTGRGLRHIAQNQFRNGHCIGIDVSAPMISLAAKNTHGLSNVSVEKADFLSWNPPEGMSFDTIFSMEVFYYFPDIQRALERAVSMLAPGGMLFVLVDHYKENADCHDWSEKLGVPMQMWSQLQYAAGFTSAGLRDVTQLLLRDPSESDAPEPPTLCTIGTSI